MEPQILLRSGVNISCSQSSSISLKSLLVRNGSQSCWWAKWYQRNTNCSTILSTRKLSWSGQPNHHEEKWESTAGVIRYRVQERSKSVYRWRRIAEKSLLSRAERKRSRHNAKVGTKDLFIFEKPSIALRTLETNSQNSSGRDADEKDAETRRALICW